MIHTEQSPNIFLLRHGEDEDNFNRTFNGRRDTPLTPHGREQVTTLAQRIKEDRLDFVGIYTSPLKRASQTGEIVSVIAEQPTPLVLTDLIERDVGVLTGMTVSEAEKNYTGETFEHNGKVYFLNPEGGETFSDLRIRAENVLHIIKSRHTEGNILLCAHKVSLAMVYAVFHDLPWEEALQACSLKNAELMLLKRPPSV